MITGYGNWFFNRSKYTLNIGGLECKVTRKTSNIFQWIKSFFITPPIPNGFVEVELKNRSIVIIKADTLATQLGLTTDEITTATKPTSTIIDAAQRILQLKPHQQKHVQAGNISLTEARKLADFFKCDINTIIEDASSFRAAQKAFVSCKEFDNTNKLNSKDTRVKQTTLGAFKSLERLKLTLRAFNCREKKRDLSTIENNNKDAPPWGVKQDNSGKQQLHLLAGKYLGKGGYGIVVETYDLFTGKLSGEAIKIAKLKDRANDSLGNEILITKRLNPNDNSIGLQKRVRHFTHRSKKAESRTIHWGPKYDSDLTDTSGFTDTQRLNAASDLFKGVTHAHSLHITHGDIKPRNIFYNHSTQKVFLADWGESIDFTREGSYPPASYSRLYRSQQDAVKSIQLTKAINKAITDFNENKTRLLKAALMRHEQACDVFASCMTLIKMYTSYYPFGTHQPYSSDAPPLKPELKKDLESCGLSKLTIELIYKGLSKNSIERPSAAEIRDALQNESPKL